MAPLCSRHMAGFLASFVIGAVGQAVGAHAVLGQAPAPRAELLRLVPKEFPLCLTVTDLRRYALNWEKSAWLQSFKQTFLGQALAKAPEVRDLLRFREDLKNH